MKKNMPWWAGQYPFKPEEKYVKVLRRNDVIPRTYGNGDNRIATRLYASTDKLTCAGFTIKPGFAVEPPDIHSGDEVYFVSSGVVTLVNPDTGQTFLAEEGSGFLIPWGTWHIPCNLTSKTAEAICFFSPNIWSEDERGTDIKYEKKPKFPDFSNPQSFSVKTSTAPCPTFRLGSHPVDGRQARNEQQMMSIGLNDAINLAVGKKHHILYRFLVSNDLIHVACAEIPPGLQSENEAHGGDEIACVISGVLSVLVDEPGIKGVNAQRFEAKAGEKILIPQETRHKYINFGEDPVIMVKGIAPLLLSGQVTAEPNR